MSDETRRERRSERSREDREQRRSRRNREEKGTKRADGGKPKILIVDDEVANLENLRMTFRRDFEILMAPSGEEGLASLEDNMDICVIVADFNMPGMKGDVFLEESQKILPDAVRMILSGHAHNKVEDMISSINRGNIFRYISKPFDMDDMHSAITSAIKFFQVKTQLSQTQEELVEAQKLAMVGSFAGGIAHEVKNQLSGLSIAQVMQQKYKDNPDILRYADMILRAKDRILGIVEEIRDYVRNEKTRYELRDMPLKEFVDDVLNIVRFDTDLRGVDIEQEIDDACKVHVNQDKLSQVLINLIRNGAHAMDETPAEDKVIIIKAGVKDSMGFISVTDKGTGISPENLEKIWEPFFSTKGKKGTGLGLELCKRIVEEGHKGNIHVESELGKGTTFTVEVPKAE